MTSDVVVPVVLDLQLPAGILGPTPIAADVRCFLVPHDSGVLIVDAGPPGSAPALARGLEALGAVWSDVTDVVLTHSHFDHTGGLPALLATASAAAVWAGAHDAPDIAAQAGHPVTPLADGARLRGMHVVATPGHTPGHISMLDQSGGLLLVGDVAGVLGGTLGRAPAAFTADPELAERSLHRLCRLGADRALFSHGPEIASGVSQLQALADTARPSRP
ncbi:MAG: MBL fold metallo-hydrolase [Solirubrobacteraceae bacterium]